MSQSEHAPAPAEAGLQSLHEDDEGDYQSEKPYCHDEVRKDATIVMNLLVNRLKKLPRKARAGGGRFSPVHDSTR